jgi:hypothetical protein
MDIEEEIHASKRHRKHTHQIIAKTKQNKTKNPKTLSNL